MKLSELLVGESDTLESVMRQIDRTGKGIVFITDADGSLVGTVTDGDIRRAILDGTGLEAPVNRVMNSDPIVVYDRWDDAAIRTQIDTEELSSRVASGSYLTVPVLDDEDRVVDVVSISPDGDIKPESINDDSAVDTVLIIGGAGYIGSVLSRTLLMKGYEVRVLDNLIYGDSGIADLRQRDRFMLIKGDMRSIETVVEAIQGVDAVVHLAALVGDPASAIDSQKSLELNYHAVQMIAQICKYHQINRFVFASTCSVYGQVESPQTLLTEESALNPVSLYAKSKIESERAIMNLADGNFSPTIFRMATIYGLSPRMRFDLVVNVLTAKAFEEGKIPIYGGDQYRPNVHVADAARAFAKCLAAPIGSVGGEVFNIGSNEQNYRIKEIGELLSSEFPDAEIEHHPEEEDDRTYQVDFSKVRARLGFEPEWTIRSGAREIWDALAEGQFEDFTDPAYSNYKTLENSSEIVQSD